MFDIIEFIRSFLQKMLLKIPNMFFIHFISLKFFKTNQKRLLFRIYYVVLINKSAYNKLKQ